jgi:hypothetical protein
VGAEKYLCTASSVLCSTTSDEDGVVVLDQIVVKPKVLLFGKNGIIGLQAVLFE